jgi:hypothetical protein
MTRTRGKGLGQGHKLGGGGPGRSGGTVTANGRRCACRICVEHCALEMLQQPAPPRLEGNGGTSLRARG